MDAGENQSVSELLCHEGDSCLDEEEDGSMYEDTCSSSGAAMENTVDDDEYLNAMIERERRMDEPIDETDSFDKCAREEAVSWIFKMRAMLGLELQTAYLSISYFDRFLAKRSINSDQSWAFRLLSIACVSLAAKMEEIRVPPLTFYQFEDYNFGAVVVRKMELLVLSTLEWKMLCVSPFVFLSLFEGRLCDDDNDNAPVDLKKKAHALIIGLIREENSIMHKPSAVAAAAIVLAMGKSLTRSILNPLLNAAFPFFDDAMRCFEAMREMNMEEKVESVEKGSTFMVSSSHRSKRRRLRFDGK